VKVRPKEKKNMNPIKTYAFLLIMIPLLYFGCTGRAPVPYMGLEPPADEPVVFGPGIISTPGCAEMGIAWMPDGREFYFGRSETSEVSSNWAIWVVRWKKGGWSKPEIAPFSGVYRDFAPFITPDGRHIIFFRMSNDRAEARQGSWLAGREGNLWGEPRFFSDAYCLNTADFRTFYCSAGTPGQNTGRDIHEMIYVDGKFSSARAIPGQLNSPEFEAHQFISPDGNLLLFDSARPGGVDSHDMYVSFKRADNSWGEALNLGAKINRGNFSIPSLSPDGKFIFCAAGGDIYWVSSSVLKDLEKK
jgi:Tol biopolymer transport system component